MSAYVVAPATINLIVSAAQRFSNSYLFHASIDARDQPRNWEGEALSTLPHTDTQQMFDLLWNENLHSVNSRYRLNDPTPTHQFSHVDLDHASAGLEPAILVLGSIRCLRYQSWEASDYESTNARRLLDWIESACVAHLIDVAEAPWGWTPDWTAQKRAEVKARIAQQMGLA